MLIDTHAHLDYTDYDPDRAEVIARATAAGVTEIISIGTKIESSSRALELAENFPNIWATVGIHPSDVDNAPDDVIPQLRKLAQSSRVVAIGEIGLDYHHLPEGPEKVEANKQLQAKLISPAARVNRGTRPQRRDSSARLVGRHAENPG